MKRWVPFVITTVLLVAALTWLVIENAGLRREVEQLRNDLAIRKAIQDEIGRGMGRMPPAGKNQPR